MAPLLCSYEYLPPSLSSQAASAYHRWLQCCSSFFKIVEEKESGWLWWVEAAIRLMIWLFTCPRTWLGSDTTCRDHRSLATNNVRRRYYVTSRRLAWRLLFCLAFHRFALGDTGAEETGGGRGGCRNLHTISLFSLSFRECFLEICKQKIIAMMCVCVCVCVK